MGQLTWQTGKQAADDSFGYPEAKMGRRQGGTSHMGAVPSHPEAVPDLF